MHVSTYFLDIVEANRTSAPSIWNLVLITGAFPPIAHLAELCFFAFCTSLRNSSPFDVNLLEIHLKLIKSSLYKLGQSAGCQ